MCRTGRNEENVITGIKVNKSYVTSTFLRGKMPTLNDNDELPMEFRSFMGTNSMEICIKIRAPVSTKRTPVRRLTGLTGAIFFFGRAPVDEKLI